jgi:hypothetical protein
MRFAETTSSLSFAFVALLAACSGQAVDVGSNGDAGGPGSGGGGTFTSTAGTGSTSTAPVGAGPLTGPVWTDPEECVVGAGMPHAGTWTGYAQGEGHEYDFTLVLGGSSENPCGTIRFGEPVELAPATDIEVPYPANYGALKHIERLQGFTYKLLDVEVDGSRVQFQAALAQPYASWCGLQLSYPNPNIQGYSCLPTYGEGAMVQGDECHATGVGAEGHVYSCDHYFACLSSVADPCDCNASGCQANKSSGADSFDLSFDETEASGEMSGKMSTKTVLLEKE